MKTKSQYMLIALLFIFASCESSTEESSKNANGNHSTGEKSNAKESSDEVYSPLDNCESLIESMDFSSLCFTEKSTPEYRVEISGDRNCQYEFYADNKEGDIHMSIMYSDYENSIYASEEDPDMPRLMFEQSFKQKRKSRALYTKSSDVKNLGDDAFIGYNEYNKQKSLAVRISNVSFTIQLNQIDTKTSCLESDEELMKFARIVVDGIKN